MPTEFEPLKHYCKECNILSVAEIKKRYAQSEIAKQKRKIKAELKQSKPPTAARQAATKPCKVCGKEVANLIYYTNRHKCGDCFKDYNQKKYLNFRLHQTRPCHKCGETKPISEFEPKKLYCKVCKETVPYVRPKVNKAAKAESQKKWLSNNRDADNKRRRKNYAKKKVKIEVPEMYGKDPYIKEINKFQQTKKAVIENPDKIINVKKVTYQKIKVDNYGRSNKVVRKGWDETMNEIRNKIKNLAQ